MASKRIKTRDARAIRRVSSGRSDIDFAPRYLTSDSGNDRRVHDSLKHIRETQSSVAAINQAGENFWKRRPSSQELS